MNRPNHFHQNITNGELPDVFQQQMEQVATMFKNNPDKSFDIGSIANELGQDIRAFIYLILYKLENGQNSAVLIQSQPTTGGMMPVEYRYSFTKTTGE